MSGGSPSEMLLQWRTDRLSRFASGFDASRYHLQVLFVDDDGVRARTCEAMLERVALYADAGWWIYPHAASTTTNVANGDAAPPSLLRTAERLGLCRSRLQARSATLCVEDLDSYDLIVAVDLAVLEEVRALAAGAADGGGSGDADGAAPPLSSLVCVTDFLSIGYGDRAGRDGERMEALDDEMRSFLAPRYAAASSLLELPSAHPSARTPAQAEAWEELLCASALCCAALTSFVKERFVDFFEDAFNDLLAAHYPTAQAAAVPWEEAETAMRRHQVTGGLTIERRRALFEAHRERLAQ